jgi:L-amino acid N-acyltransferase YncA
MRCGRNADKRGKRETVNLLDLSKKVGAGLLRERAWQQLWLDKMFYCLRCDLAALPARPPAKMAITMRPFDLLAFHGFQEEFARVEGHDAVEVYARERLRLAGVETGYLGGDEQGAAAYVHWLVLAKQQERLHAFQPGRYRELKNDEALIEGAYTFTEFRGRGLMNTGMHQLLELAREAGVRTVWTYVAVENVPSLRGCARVGFTPDHLRHNHRRFGEMKTEFVSLTSEASARWQQSVAA